MVEVIERANPSVVRRLRSGRRAVRTAPEAGASARTSSSRRRTPAGRARGRSWWPSCRRAARPHRADRARRRGAGQLRRSRHGIEIALRKHDLPQVFAGRRKVAAKSKAGEGATSTAARTFASSRSSPSTARPRGTSTTRCIARDARGLPPVGRDRRRQPLRAPRRRARPRGARARQLGVLSAARDPDAAGEAVERAVLAQPGRRPPVHGVRDDDRPNGEIGRYEFYPAVIRSHARLTYTEVADDARESERASGRRHRALVPQLRTSTGSTMCSPRRARSAARSTSRRSRRR